MASTPPLPESLQRLVDKGHLAKMVLDTESGPCLLFLRHSDRPHLPPNTSGPNVHLTADGVARARRLGSALKELRIGPGAILTCSPITRTIETLNEICVGAGWTDHQSQRIERDKRIFGPGTIYGADIDVDKVVASYMGTETHRIINEIVGGNEKRFYGVKPFDEGAQGLVSLILEALSRPTHAEIKGLSIMVSHDLQLAYLLAKLFGIKQFTRETWPPFLDSILFQLAKGKNGNRLKAVYGDKVVERDC